MDIEKTIIGFWTGKLVVGIKTFDDDGWREVSESKYPNLTAAAHF